MVFRVSRARSVQKLLSSPLRWGALAGAPVALAASGFAAAHRVGYSAASMGARAGYRRTRSHLHFVSSVWPGGAMSGMHGACDGAAGQQ